MIERITKNEDRLNESLAILQELEIALEKFKNNRNNIRLLNKYYGSKTWFQDKKIFEQQKINNIKAGVLSEDAIWNLNEDIKDLMKEMQVLISKY